MSEELYVATGACAPCPYRQHCHTARQRAVDKTGLGRHTSCTYYREFDRRAAAAADLVADRARERGLVARVVDRIRGRGG